jgi:gliding motility-associated-like protein
VETVGRCGSYRDSFYVSHTPRPFTALPLEVAACRASPPILTVNPGNYRWSWPDGSTTVSFATDTTLDFVVLQYSNHCGSWRDTTFLYWVSPEPYADIDTVLCQGEPFTLQLATNRFTRVNWSDGDTSTNRLFREPFVGSARIVTACGEHEVSIRLARERCDCELWLPSAFSPNGDGLNDSYVATPECEASLFELYIYDRWGRLVFETTNPAQGWDGTFGGQAMPEGQYAVKARYVGQYTRELKTPGTFLYLMR